MPFQSEKQRRYLWANEPEIARDWSDTYGHRAQGYDGGVMRVPFAEGKTSIPAWNLATLKQGLELATTDKEKAQIQSQIDRIEGDMGTGADTLLGSGEAPTKGFWGNMSDMFGMSQADGSEATAEDLASLERFSPEEKAKSARTAMLFSRTKTLLSLPMLLSMVMAQNLY